MSPARNGVAEALQPVVGAEASQTEHATSDAAAKQQSLPSYANLPCAVGRLLGLFVLLLLAESAPCALLNVHQLSRHVRRDFMRAALAYVPDDTLVSGLDDTCLSAAGSPPIHVLLLGDSVSRFQVFDTCSRWKGILNRSCLAGLHYYFQTEDYGNACCRSRARQPLPGTSRTDPRPTWCM